jgi:hypothetical protein
MSVRDLRTAAYSGTPAGAHGKRVGESAYLHQTTNTITYSMPALVPGGCKARMNQKGWNSDMGLPNQSCHTTRFHRDSFVFVGTSLYEINKEASERMKDTFGLDSEF